MVQYVKESYEELKNHVTWPTLADSQREMVVVVVFSILFSLVIWGMDSLSILNLCNKNNGECLDC